MTEAKIEMAVGEMKEQPRSFSAMRLENVMAGSSHGCTELLVHTTECPWPVCELSRFAIT